MSPGWILVILAVASGLIATGKWIGNVNTDRTSFTKFMDEVKNKLDQIFLRLPPPRLSVTESPVVLSDLGRKVSEAMSIKAWATETAPTLAEKVAGLKEHRVYEFCTRYTKDMDLTEEEMDRALELAYEHGFEPDGVRTAYAIELRDALLALREAKSDE